MNLPNKLTLFRIILIPIFVVLLLKTYYYYAAAVFIIASLTDFLDGYLARKYHLVTNFGKLMDPLADKLLVTSALVCLVELGDIPSWMVIIILSREFTISILRAVAASDGKVIAASKWGKSKTIFQMIAVISILIKNYPFERLHIPFSDVVLWIAVILTVVSGIDYIIKNKEFFQERGD